MPTRAQTLVDEALDILAEEDDPVARFDALTARAQIGALARGHGRRRALHGAGVRARDGRRPEGPPDDRGPGPRADAHRAPRARRGGAPADARSRARRGERQRSRARRRHARVRLVPGRERRARRGGDRASRRFVRPRPSSGSSRRSPRRSRGSAVSRGVAATTSEPRSCTAKRSESPRRRGDRGVLPDLQASLAETLAALGKVDEAERLALEVQSSDASRRPALRASRSRQRWRRSVPRRVVTTRPRSSIARRSRRRRTASQ